MTVGAQDVVWGVCRKAGHPEIGAMRRASYRIARRMAFLRYTASAAVSVNGGVMEERPGPIAYEYKVGEPSQASPCPERCTTPSPVQDDADTPEELLEEMKWGADMADNGSSPELDAQRAAAKAIAEEYEKVLPFSLPADISPDEHHAIARRALLIGTVLAVLGTLFVICLSMWAMGFHTAAEVLAYVGSRDARHLQRLRDSGEEVVVVELDLTNVQRLDAQLAEVWTVLNAYADIEEDQGKPKA